MSTKISRLEMSHANAIGIVEKTQFDLNLQFRLPAHNARSIPSLQAALQRMVDVALSNFDVDQKVINDADKMAQLLVANVTPNPVLVEERIGRQTTISEIIEKGKFLTGEEINAGQAKPKGNQHSVASDWKRRGRIFSVTYDGKDLYPAYQFDMNNQPLPAIREVLLILKESDPWAIASWFHFPNSWITAPVGDPDENKYVAVAPKDALKNRWEDVIKAAEKERGTYFA